MNQGGDIKSISRFEHYIPFLSLIVFSLGLFLLDEYLSGWMQTL